MKSGKLNKSCLPVYRSHSRRERLYGPGVSGGDDWAKRISVWQLQRLWKWPQSVMYNASPTFQGEDAFSLVEALYILMARLRCRTCLVAVLVCAGLFIAFIPLLPRVAWWTQSFRNSLVFIAPVGGHISVPPSTEPPKFIPRVIHQTYPSLKLVPREVASIRQTWSRLNPGWEMEFWDDSRCLQFVREEFPEYQKAYAALPKNVERADFFRYLVVLRHGGVYADIDAELRVPLDDFIGSTDMLVVGWEAEVPDEAEMLHRHLARKRQVQQWFFAGAPGHPALRRVCDHIAANHDRHFSPFANLDTLERTGPGAWTDAVLATADEQLLRTVDSSRRWGIRFLPQVATGVHPTSTPGLHIDSQGVLVLHHFLGSWKATAGFQRETLLSKLWLRLHPPRAAADSDGEASGDSAGTTGVLVADGGEGAPALAFAVGDAAEQRLYPVSISHGATTFTAMVPLVGHGDLQSHEDAAAVLTRFGNWQAGMDAALAPRAAVALAGALGSPAPNPDGTPAPVLLDAGAGLGFYSLTAAARGHRVIATELAPRSIAALRASLAVNNATSLVSLANVTLGSTPGRACVALSGAAAAATTAHGWRAEDIARGFASPSLHADTTPPACSTVARRAVLGELVPDGVRVGALRVSAGAWTADTLRGGLPLLARHRPAVILIELDMAEMARAGSSDFPDVLQELQALGYTNIGHAGHVCVARFEAMMATLRERRVAATLQTEVDDLRQPAWCELPPESVGAVLEANRANGLERQDPMNASGVELLLLQLGPPAADASEGAAAAESMVR